MAIFKVSDYAAGVSGSAGFFWRGYRFTVSRSTVVTHMIGGGTEAGDFNGGIYTADSNGVPQAIVGQITFPGTTPEQEVPFSDPITLIPGQEYVIAQGRAGSAGQHHLLTTTVNATQLVAGEEIIQSWLPDGTAAQNYRFGTTGDNPIGNSPEVDSTRIAVGFRYQATYTIPTDRQVHFDLQILRSDDTTAVSVGDWVTKCDVEHGNVDAVGTGNSAADGVVRTCTFTLVNDGAVDFTVKNEDSSINQFGGSYDPLLFPGRLVVVYVGLTEPGGGGDWIELFRGYLGDSIRTGEHGNIITLECRDLAKKIQDTVIERDGDSYRTYPQTQAAEPVEQVLQDILDDNNLSHVVIYTPSGTSSVPIDSGESPYWDIPWEADEPLQPGNASVWDVLQQIVAQFGWYLGYLWHEPTSAYQLVLMEPPTSKDINSADYTLSHMGDIYTQELDITDRDIRNVIVVGYRDKATEAADEEISRETVSVTDPSSIDVFGRRVAEIDLADTDLIDDSTKANRLANAILDSLKDISAQTRLDMPLFPQAEIFAGLAVNNSLISSEPIFFGVESVRHILRFSGGAKFRTEIIGTGKIVAGHQRWLRMQRRDGARKPFREEDYSPVVQLPAPAAPTVNPTPRGIEVIFKAPLNLSWAYTELHVSLEHDFTPTVDTLMQKALDTEFVAHRYYDHYYSIVRQLKGGYQVYVKIVHVDRFGNKSAASPGVLATAGGETTSSTLVIAAVDSSTKGKAGADYVCDGTADQAVINEAIEELEFSGGMILLLEGTYVINDAIRMMSNITLAGQGHGTVIKLMDAFPAGVDIIMITNFFSTIKDITIRDLTLDGNRASALSSEPLHGIHFGEYSSLMAGENIRLEGLLVKDVKDEAVSLRSTNVLSSKVKDSIIRGSGIGIIVTDGSIIKGNHVYNNDLVAIGIFGDNSIVSENEIYANRQLGVDLRWGANNNKIDGNSIYNNNLDYVSGGAGIFIQGLPSQESHDNIFINNIIRNAPGNLQDYGIYIVHSDVINTLVSNNDLYASGDVAALRDDGTGTSFGAGNRLNDGSWVVGEDAP